VASVMPAARCAASVQSYRALMPPNPSIPQTLPAPNGPASQDQPVPGPPAYPTRPRVIEDRQAGPSFVIMTLVCLYAHQSHDHESDGRTVRPV